MKQEGPLVLVVDDDEAIRTALERALRLEGFAVEVADGGRRALELTEEHRPGVIVLDVVMPDLSGVRVVSRLRERESRRRSASCQRGMRSRTASRGSRPARTTTWSSPSNWKSWWRGCGRCCVAGPSTESELLRIGDLIVDPAQRSANRGGRAIDLTRREFELLEELVRHRGVVLSRQQLLERVWGYDFEVDGNVVDVFVGYLRRKLEAAGEPRMIHTVRGVGFVVRP